jgi:hypothetical protein
MEITTAWIYSHLHTLGKKTDNRIIDIWMKMDGFTLATGHSCCCTASSNPPSCFNVRIQSGEEQKEVLSYIHPFSDWVEIVDPTLPSRSRDAIRIIWKEEFYHRAYQQGLDLSGSSDPSSIPIGFSIV